ncbi:peroxidase [Rhodohalobacter sp. SW132]|uniref:peroxidase-related enzyme n=1 Tax=Rhodohalobacter sp. SW132 TaxID=2293433 RepID=UPI000E252A13|nr:peroxidase-related enzyme [Rhodohalobacter sp. SW132]REL38801.1 peroxidase [Rhodohalobacter sp. SW132]
MPNIETISYEKSEGRLREVYDQVVSDRGKLAEVHKIQSLNPDALLTHMEFYLTVMFGKSPLKRYQREMMAVVVSLANECQYCIEHHEQALMAYWKDEKRISALKNDFREAELSEKDLLLCKLAEKLTVKPGSGFTKNVAELKQHHFDDRAVLDAVQVIAYFNFVNRMVLALDVEFTGEEKKGYKY